MREEEKAAQRQRALAKSSFVRSQRKELRSRLRAGTLDPWVVLRGASDEWEPVVAEMRVDRYLELVPGIGEVTRDEALDEFRLRGHWRVGYLTYERRAELADKLRMALAGEPMPPAQRPAA